MKKVRITVSGRVQNVGFRFFTLRLASSLDIKGYVQNQNDGTVYIEAVGEETAITHFIQALHGPMGPSAKVSEVITEEDARISDYTDFKIQ